MPGPGLSPDQVDDIFTFHPPTNDAEVSAHENVRLIMRNAAHEILSITPVCPEQTTAIRKLQEAMMFSNAAIAINGVPEGS